MWLSGRWRQAREELAVTGATTLAGDLAGAYLDGERRELPIYGPGGYCWRPVLEEELLVLKGGDGHFVAGARCGQTLPGEVLIFAAEGGASIRLKNDGSVELTGRVLVNGTPIEELGGGASGTGV